MALAVGVGVAVSLAVAVAAVFIGFSANMYTNREVEFLL